MAIIRILWDNLVEDRIKKKHDDVSLILSCLKDIDRRIDDLEEQLNEINSETTRGEKWKSGKN
jgi:peptidoglycan hydrolase CwlO-like protein